MEYETFLQTVRSRLQDLAGPEFTVTMQRVPKNNGVVLDGLCIGTLSERITPTIYLNSYYQQYLEGMSLEEITGDILSIYRNRTDVPAICLNGFSDLEQVRDRIVYKLVNSGANRELLNEIPHLPYLDLAIVFYLFLNENESGQTTALICNEHLESWRINSRELYRLASENTPRLFPAQIKSMQEVMKEIAREHMGDSYREEFIDGLFSDPSDAPPLFVLTNESGINGACCLLYEGQLENFSERTGGDLIVLPSSIHEVLLIPDGPDISCENLGLMVAEINRSEVPEEDRLSNQIYLYSRAGRRLSIIYHSSVPIGTANP